jgi:hypothetical protein
MGFSPISVYMSFSGVLALGQTVCPRFPPIFPKKD